MLTHRRQRPVRSSRNIKRRLRTRRRSLPTCREELSTRRKQILGSPANSFRFTHKREGIFREQFEQGRHSLAQDRRQRLHALDVDTVGQRLQDVDQLGILLREFARTRSDLRSQQHFTTRRRPQSALHQVQRTLVRDRERPDLLDLIAEEFEAKWVVVCRYEDVDNSAAYRQLPTPRHQVRAPVANRHKLLDDGFKPRAFTSPHTDRLQIPESGDDGLQQRPNSRHYDLDLARAGPSVVWVCEPTQDLESAPHCVVGWAQPFVREGFPGREFNNCISSQKPSQFRCQILGLARRRGDC